MNIMEQIERELDTRLPYRIGCPKLPVLPAKSEPFALQHIFPDPEKTLSIILGILRQHGIEIGSGFVGSDHLFNDGHDKLPTITIAIDYDPATGSDHWIEAVKSSREYMLSEGHDVAIQIIDFRIFALGHVTEPIAFDDQEITRKWKQFYPTLAEHLKQHLWVTLDVLHRGIGENECKPTIVIGALDANDESWWSDTLPALREKVPDGLEIELLFGTNVLASKEDIDIVKEPGEIIGTMAPYTDEVPMGSSCGVSGLPTTGTIGGCFRLSHGTGIQNYGLSNHHVLCKDHTGDRGWLAPNHELQAAIVVPSDRDHRDFQKQLKKLEHHASSRLARAKKDITEQKWVPTRENKLAQTKADIEETNTFNRHFGQIFASSGFRTALYDEDTGGLEDQYGNKLEWALDWCLVQPIPERNIWEVTADAPRGMMLISSYRAAIQYRTLVPKTNCKVVKKGRSTDWTRGRISKIPGVINMWTIPQARGESAIEVIHTPHHLQKDGTSKPVLCYSVVGSDDRPFGSPGDSGSLVLLDDEDLSRDEPPDDAVIIGLMFGAGTHKGATYMTPISAVVEDIERVTKEKVLKPFCAGEVVNAD